MTSYKDVLVTKEQHEIILKDITPSNALYIKSGPGTGKTLTLVLKIAYMINELEVDPSEILVLSMTNKAVDNLKDNLDGLIADDKKEQLNINTFHAFCHDLVTAFYGDEVDILQDEGLRILVQLFDNKKVNDKYKVAKFIRMFKDNVDHELIRAEFDLTQEEINSMINIFSDMKLSTYSDLLKRGKTIIQSLVKEEKLNFRVVVVDEFQDMYNDLFQIIKAALGPNSHLIFAGDTNQSIYKFLDTKVPSKIEDLGKTFDVLEMSESFRSTDEILSASKYLLGKEINVFSNHYGLKPTINNFNSDLDQYEFIIKEIKKLQSYNVPLHDIAVLSRTNYELTKIARLLKMYRLDFIKLSSSPNWLQNDNFIYLIDYLKILLNPYQANFSILCTLKLMPMVGPKTLRQVYEESVQRNIDIWGYLSRSKDPKLKIYYNLMQQTRKSIDFEDPKDVLQKLLKISNELGLVKKFGRIDSFQKSNITEQYIEFYSSLKTFYENPSRVSETSSMIESFLKNFMSLSQQEYSSKIKLSTIHQSKGLEFPIVFMTDFNLELDDEQEKNLRYVGMTRPKTLLYLNSIGNNVDLDKDEELKKRFTIAGSPNLSKAFQNRVVRSLHTWRKIFH
ncbi:hypothetical protein WICMUC_003664 [Wickerhamomyces mucosus]|uniref:DNA 3'-5' helicase n=1 Tax=Wickerhamomyces mucosus TaxID=1378264 RepID=A0A9P8PLG7_9ASCO|nr:hypothetical protein WICMUC_003664 [Wickerhamomyces mucosus]